MGPRSDGGRPSHPVLVPEPSRCSVAGYLESSSSAKAVVVVVAVKMLRRPETASTLARPVVRAGAWGRGAVAVSRILPAEDPRAPGDAPLAVPVPPARAASVDGRWG